MYSKVLIALCLVVITASAVPAQPGGGWGGWGGWGGVVAVPQAGGVNPWLPPWISAAPWMPQWTVCTAIGSACIDCNTKLVCTKVGGLQRACSDPTLPYCNMGECSATPSAECAPATTEAIVPL